MKGTVGASIVSIITESLYDKPIVVFREYTQNAVDALDKANSNENREDYSAQIWFNNNDLYFLDNGTGIEPEKFGQTMTAIAYSPKRKAENIGYKGIGRLSGIPYCRKLSFINITDYASGTFQEYVIDCDKYAKIRKTEIYHELDFTGLMSQIGSLIDNPDSNKILKLIIERKKLFTNRNKGFLVIMQDISKVLRDVIGDDKFSDNLGWLLPVPFMEEMLTPTKCNSNSELFSELSKMHSYDSGSAIPAKTFNIFYNEKRIYRPLKNEMLRTYLCQSNLEQYAVCVHTFSNKKIELDRKNPFSGIRIYIDNMLLCDENELIPALRQYGYIRQGSTYEVIQSVRGIGAMIYIVDKINISANARRTFIDVIDQESFNFLSLIGQFVESIYTARYALSHYDSAKRKNDTDQEKLKNLKEHAIQSLINLARSDITIETENAPEPVDFKSLSKTEQKRIVKNAIIKELNLKIKKYLSQTEEYNFETCVQDFKTWLNAN